MAKIIMHIDLNAFFATAEETKDPSLVGKPLAVGGTGRRGVVSTANYEARKWGVSSAMPMYQALEKCPELIVKPADFRYYEMLSNSFFAYVRRFTPLIEKASIDECWADMTEALKGVKDPVGYFKGIQDGLLSELGLKCSIGVAPTKFLAKMASDLKKPMGLTLIRRRDVASIIYPLPIESFWGIGKRTSPRLRSMGIETIGDLASRMNSDDATLAKEFGKGFQTIKDWVNGYGDDVIETERPDAKSISHSETLEHDTSDVDEILEKIYCISSLTASGAQNSKKKGKTITLKIRDSSFKTKDKSVTIEESTNDAATIYKFASELFKRHFLGTNVRLIGVGLSNLVDPLKETVQMSFFNYEDYEKLDETKLLVNELNRKMKKPMLRLASEAKKDGNQ